MGKQRSRNDFPPQIDHYKDRAAICKFNPFLAPASMNATVMSRSPFLLSLT